MESFNQYIQNQITVIMDEIVRLGPTQFRLVSNMSEFPALRYFSKTARTPYQDEETTFELWCVSLEKSSLDQEYILSHIDRTYRGNSFLDGYYATDHFGSPVYLVTCGQRFFVFGEQLERVVWPYFVKYFLMLHTIQGEALHLKGAACVIGTSGTLILGRGGTGKTVFLTQLCQHGAGFVTNSHAIIKDGQITGVASSIRIRSGPWFFDLIDKVEQNPALKAGEIIIDPYDVFDIHIYDSVEIKNLCIIDFQQPGRHVIKKLSEQDAYNYAEQFSLAINVYRLEEDLLDLYKDDYKQFTQVYNKMKSRLKQIVQQSNCYYISSDMLDPTYRNEIFDLLSI